MEFSARICGLVEDAGVCFGSFEKWRYAGGKCTPFIFGGCGGNENQFDSKAECESFCLNA